MNRFEILKLSDDHEVHCCPVNKRPRGTPKLAVYYDDFGFSDTGEPGLTVQSNDSNMAK